MPRFNVNRKSEFEPSKKSDDSIKQNGECLDTGLGRF